MSNTERVACKYCGVDHERAGTPPCPPCWGCVDKVPRRGDEHVEETDIPGTVYAYPCGAVPA